MATWRSDSYEGRYLELSITEAVDTVSNTSTLYWTLTSAGGSSSYYTVDTTTVTINGVTVYSKGRTYWSDKVFPAAKGSVSGSVTVSHNSDGSKTIDVGFSTRVYVFGSQEYGGSMALTSIDRTAPSVSFGISNITANSLKISASSSVTASQWWYSLNGGTSWTEFGSEGTSKEVTVTGLTPNTSYNVQVCARKKSNQVDGYSSKASYKTLGGTVINSASTVTADSDTVKVTMGLNVYDGTFYHKLTIKNGSTTILTTAAVKFSASGTSSRSITLTAAERTKLLNAMANMKSFTATLELATYSGAACTTQVGSASTKTCTITTTESISKPAFTDFSYVDSRGLVGNLTGNTGDNVILIQSYSSLVVNAVAGTAKNGATIKSYSASIGSASKTSSSTAIDVGVIDSYGDSMVLTVSCIDSRGYATSVTKRVKVLKYEKPKLYSVTLRRKDEIEDIIQLAFRGAISSLKPDGETEKNALKFAGYYYKKTTEDAWSDFVSIKGDVTESGTSFTFSAEQLMLSATAALSLDTELSYDFHLLVRDKLDTYASYDDYFVIPQGKPLVSLRKRDGTYDFPRVGINNPNPTEALDVAGNVKCSGTLKAGEIIINEKTLQEYLLNFVRPVGSYYWSDDETSPEKLFGGTWTRIKDCFLLAAGDTYAAGKTGGEASHTLTVDEIPDHTHSYQYTGQSTVIGTDAIRLYDGNGQSNQYTGQQSSNCGGKAHNNMPPYRAAYCWRRTK